MHNEKGFLKKEFKKVPFDIQIHQSDTRGQHAADPGGEAGGQQAVCGDRTLLHQRHPAAQGAPRPTPPRLQLYTATLQQGRGGRGRLPREPRCGTGE